jgi:hypothetical protein
VLYAVPSDLGDPQGAIGYDRNGDEVARRKLGG